MKKIICATIVSGLALSSSATIINIPADYPTIQQGIDASVDGDTVLVQPGTYVENINFNAHNIVLGSLFLTTGDTSYIEQTAIDGDGWNAVISFENGEDSIAIIAGFTIQNGLTPYGGGIYLNNANPIIRENTIKTNNAGRGGGVYCNNSSPLIISNRIESNVAFGPEWLAIGGGISCDGNSAPVIDRNNIKDNSAYGNYGGQGGGIDISYYCNPVVLNNKLNNNSAMNGGAIYDDGQSLFEGNLIINNNGGRGGGVFFHDNYSIFINNTVSGNGASWNGGGLYINGNVEIVNNIIWGNASQEGSQLSIHSGNPSIAYCNIQDTLWPGIGNIDVDPLFRDPVNGDFHLMSIACGDSADSPCIDAGDPDILDSLLDCSWGLGGPRSDMGAYGGGDSLITGIFENMPSIPDRILLLQNYPNPFNARTTIRFVLPKSQDVELTIYDLLGRQVEVIIDEYRQAGVHALTFDASSLSSGFYFYRLQAGEAVETKRMVLLK